MSENLIQKKFANIFKLDLASIDNSAKKSHENQLCDTKKNVLTNMLKKIIMINYMN